MGAGGGLGKAGGRLRVTGVALGRARGEARGRLGRGWEGLGGIWRGLRGLERGLKGRWEGGLGEG